MHSTIQTKPVVTEPRRGEPEVIANFEYTEPLVQRWKTNVDKALEVSGTSFRTFHKLLISNGIIMDRALWYRKELKKFPNFLYLGTFSRILGIEPGYLLLKEFPELLESGKIKPNLIEMPEPIKRAKKKAA